MLAKMRSMWRTTWRQLYTSTVTLLPTQGAYEMTRASWAKAIKSYDAVPDVYQSFFEPLLAEGQAFPYVILTPSYEGFLYKAAEKLVCDFGNEIYILEKSGSTFETQCYPLEKIIYVEFRTILLDSRIKISGVTKQGASTSSTFKFNSVTDYLFKPIIKRIRLHGIEAAETIESSELEKFDPWATPNFKFMSFAKHSLLGGEKVIQSVLQPEIRKSIFTILGKTYYRTIAPTHAVILTDRELIIIREEERQSGEDKYGGTWAYVPLRKILSLTLGERENDLFAFSIQVCEGEQLEFLFQVSMREEIERLLEQFRELAIE